LLILGVIALAAIPTGGGDTAAGRNGGGGGGSGGGDQSASDSASQSPEQAEGSGETFTAGNYPELVSDPEAHEGAEVNITGQIFTAPEIVEGNTGFQMFADPENGEWNTAVLAEGSASDFEIDDYVHVVGTVVGEMEGENAMGGTVTAVMVQASDVSTVSAGQAIDPATEVREIGQTLGDQGFEVTLDKIEFGEDSTRAYVKMANNTGRGASFYTFDAKIQQGSTQVDYLEDSFAYYEEEPQSELRPGVETEGVLAFESVNPDEPFELIVPWSSDNYNINARDIVFQVTP
jgi:hypothetical protein